jgi:hypothetical protein
MPKIDDFLKHSIFPSIIEELALIHVPVITNIPVAENKKQGIFHADSVKDAKAILKSLTAELSSEKGEKASEVFSDSMLSNEQDWIDLENSILSGFSF